jgi:two-component system, chemotaxis family, CheB/CheR fusion protein
MPTKKSQPKESRTKKGATKQENKLVTAGKETAKSATRRPASSATKPSCIVGIGASAGGLEALEQFLNTMPHDSGLAFLVVPHLDPTHISMMTNLLERHTQMKVMQAANGMKVQSDCVYIIPPNTDMALRNKKIVLSQMTEPRGHRFPIDYFFRSLAKDQKERAIAIVLSGNGRDGTLGIKAIKSEHGMVMAQEMSTAKYDGMPSSAIETGLVDFVLPPQKMPEQLIKYIEHSKTPPRVGPVSNVAPGALQKILVLLRSHTGQDFTFYRKNTICRRIERRMNVHQHQHIDDYLRHLQEQPTELDKLFRELLIGVTNFFRDPEAFGILKEKLLVPMLASIGKQQTVRIWVPGCSGGEEVYSLAMTLRESIDQVDSSLRAQIFGTDIDNESIQQARHGLYPASIAADVNPERLLRFFVKEDSSYRVTKDIREMAMFAFQNVLKDAPFTKLHLLSCRNLLIYLEPELQKKLIPLFHYALRPGGILFLGNSETLGGMADLFEVVDKKWKLFRKRDVESLDQVMMNFPTGHPWRNLVDLPTQKEKRWSVSSLAEKLLLEKYAPPCLILDKDNNIVYAHGRTGKYLELAPGQARLNVLEMAREGLRHELARAIGKVTADKKELSLQGVKVKTNGSYQRVNVSIKLASKEDDSQQMLMIVFEDVEAKPVPPAAKAKTAPAASEKSRISQLEQDLKAAQENLQTTVEELETSNEELKSTNEELQSTNEELQSTNEELETSREELQSLNEELGIVNAELQGKIEELSGSNNDMRNLLDGIMIATLFLDNHLLVKRFTAETKKVINLIQSDIGRPLSDIVSNLDEINLVEVCQEVLETLTPKEAEVKSKKGHWYLMRIMPYRAGEKIIGIVVTFTDISQRKDNEQRLRDNREQYRLLFELNPLPMWVLDLETLKFLAVNQTALKSFGYSKEEFLTMTLKDLLAREEARSLARHRKRFNANRLTGNETLTLNWKHRHKDGTIREDEVRWRPIPFEDKQAILSISGQDSGGRSASEPEPAQANKK